MSASASLPISSHLFVIALTRKLVIQNQMPNGTVVQYHLTKKIVLLTSNIGSRTQEFLSVASIDMIGASGDASFFANYCLQSIMRRSLFEVPLPMKACSIRLAISYLSKSIIGANHQSDGDFSIQPSKQWSKWLSFTAPELAQLQFLQHSRIAEKFLPPSTRGQKNCNANSSSRTCTHGIE